MTAAPPRTCIGTRAGPLPEDARSADPGPDAERGGGRGRFLRHGLRIRQSSISPILMPCLLAAVYVLLLLVRFPHLIGWWNTDGDIAAAYTIPDAVSQGHTGQVLMGTQASWVPLWYGLLTHGLSFHRVLWEISPALLTLGTACLIGWSVSRAASRMAAVLAVAVMVCASPIGLQVLTEPYLHNTTVAGVGVLGAYLVWLSIRRRTGARLAISVLVISLVIGTFLASDELLAIVGLTPFLVAPLLLAARGW